MNARIAFAVMSVKRVSLVDRPRRGEMRIWVILIAFASASARADTPWPEYAWDCNLTAETICGPSGCNQATPTRHLIIYPSYSSYQRCNEGGCQNLSAQFAGDGRSLIIHVNGQPAIARVMDDLSIIEVFSGDENVVISRGQCRQGPPPPVVSPAR